MKETTRSRSNKTKQKAPKSKLRAVGLYALIFLAGIGLMAFPLVSQYLYHQASNAQINVFQEEIKQMDRREIDRKLALAHAYNDTLEHFTLRDPFTKLEKEAQQDYARMLEVNQLIGHIEIPKIGEDLPIYAGVSETVLQKGVGHLPLTSLPVGGVGTHSVLSAHRGLPTARLFTDLDKMEVGDVFYVHNVGETLAYQVDDIQVVEPTDVESVQIVEGEDYVTLLTCTPYMINSHRLLVRGKRIDYIPSIKEKEIRDNQTTKRYQWLFYSSLAALLAILGYQGWAWRRRRQQQKRNKSGNEPA